MNGLTPYIPSAPIAPSAGLVPANMTEAIKLAELMAGAKLVPMALQKSPADCLMVIQQAVRWAMDPFAVAQECSVIAGKLMYSGKLVAAVVNARGDLEERLSFAYAGDGDARTITVSGRLRGEQAARTVAVMLKDAKTSAAVWRTQPDQQLMYHGTRVWARRHAPELVLGVWAPEEFDETQPKEAPKGGPAISEVSPVQPVAAVPPPAHDPHTGEVGPRALPLPEAETAWRSYIAWGGQFIAAINAAQDLLEFDRWTTMNLETLRKCKEVAPKIHDRILPNIEAARAKLIAAAAKPGTSSKRGKKAAPTPAQPEEYLSRISAALDACSTPADLTAVWNEKFLPTLGDLFPPDAAVADEMFEARLAKLGQQELAEAEQ